MRVLGFGLKGSGCSFAGFQGSEFFVMGFLAGLSESCLRVLQSVRRVL